MMTQRKNIIATLIFAGIVLGTFSLKSLATESLAERQLAVNFIRTVNTAEMQYRNANHAFADWQTLLTISAVQKAAKQLSNSTSESTQTPDSMADWKVRLTVASDRNAYAIALTKTSDKCLYSVVSDEEGVVKEAKAIGCSDSSK
jgi:hypothetical protein